MIRIDDFLAMGSLGRAHGIKGELALNWHGGEPPAPGQMLYLERGDHFRILSARPHKGRYLVMLEGISDRTRAESLNGQQVFVSRADLPPLDEDEAFLADLPGCQVFLEDGSFLGVLDHLEFPAGQLVWGIKSPGGNEILLPGQPEFIADLDLAARRIVVAPPPGLLEIYNA